MKVGGINRSTDRASFYDSTFIKIWLYIAWFFGIFPINFDKKLMHFKFKLLSLNALFSQLRVFLFCLCPLLLPSIVVQIIKDWKEKDQTVTSSIDNITSQINITDTQTLIDITNKITGITNNWWVKIVTGNKLKSLNEKSYIVSEFEVLVPHLGIIGKSSCSDNRVFI